MDLYDLLEVIEDNDTDKIKVVDKSGNSFTGTHYQVYKALTMDTLGKDVIRLITDSDGIIVAKIDKLEIEEK